MFLLSFVIFAFNMHETFEQFSTIFCICFCSSLIIISLKYLQCLHTIYLVLHMSNTISKYSFDMKHEKAKHYDNNKIQYDIGIINWTEYYEETTKVSLFTLFFFCYYFITNVPTNIDYWIPNWNWTNSVFSGEIKWKWINHCNWIRK